LSFQGIAEQGSRKYIPEEGSERGDIHEVANHFSKNLRRSQSSSFLRYKNRIRRPPWLRTICNSISSRMQETTPGAAEESDIIDIESRTTLSVIQG
jgi:hypothetical protein